MKASDIKFLAKDRLSGNKFIAIVAGFIASIFGATGVGTGSVSLNTSTESEIPLGSAEAEALLEKLLPVLVGVGIFTIVYAIVMLFIGSAVSIGYAQFNQDIVNYVKPEIKTLFSKFSQMKTAVVAYLMVFVRVFFGYCLFIIPGIIAGYKYAMVSHVLAENPELSAREALQRSKELMRGNKWRLFCLHFSFIGWDILTVLTLGLLGLWVVPFKAASNAVFYQKIKEVC